MGNPGPILAHMVTPRNSDLCIHRQTLETRQGNDSFKALSNCISPLFRVFADLRHRWEMELYTYTKILRSFNTIKKLVKKYGFHNFNTTLTLRHDFNIPARLKHSEYGHPPVKIRQRMRTTLRRFGPPSQNFLLSIVCIIFGNLFYLEAFCRCSFQ